MPEQSRLALADAAGDEPLGRDQRLAQDLDVELMITLGALLVISSIVSLARPNLIAAEWATTLVGVLLFVAPWVVGYTGLTGAAWTSWLVGVVVVGVSLTEVRASNRGTRQAIQH